MISQAEANDSGVVEESKEGEEHSKVKTKKCRRSGEIFLPPLPKAQHSRTSLESAGRWETRTKANSHLRCQQMTNGCVSAKATTRHIHSA